MEINGINNSISNINNLNTENNLKRDRLEETASEKETKNTRMDRVEVTERNFIQKTETVKDLLQAQELTKQVQTEMQNNPNRAVLSQGSNISSARVANLL